MDFSSESADDSDSDRSGYASSSMV